MTEATYELVTDKPYYTPLDNALRSVRFWMTTRSTDGKRYSFVQSVDQADPLTEADVRVILHNLSNLRSNCEYDVLNSKRRCWIVTSTVLVQTGPDEWTEFCPSALRLLNRKTDDKGWCVEEDRYL